MESEMQLSLQSGRRNFVNFYRPTGMGASRTAGDGHMHQGTPPLSPSYVLSHSDEWSNQPPQPDYPGSVILPQTPTVVKFTSNVHHQVSNDVVRPTWPLTTTIDDLDSNDRVNPLDSSTNSDTYLLRSTASKEKRLLNRQNSSVRRKPSKQLSVNLDVLQTDAAYQPANLENNESNKEMQRSDIHLHVVNRRPSHDKTSEAHDVPFNYEIRLRSATVTGRPKPSSPPVKIVHPLAAPWVGPHLRTITRANSDVTGSSKKVGQEKPPWASVAQQMRENLRQRQHEGNINLNLTSTTTTDLPAPALPTSPPPPRHVTTDTQHVDNEVSSTMDVPLSPTRSEKAQSETPQWMANLKLRSKGNHSHSSEATTRPTEEKENGQPPWQSEWQTKRNSAIIITDRSMNTTSSINENVPEFVQVAKSMKTKILDIRL